MLDSGITVTETDKIKTQILPQLPCKNRLNDPGAKNTQGQVI